MEDGTRSLREFHGRNFALSSYDGGILPTQDRYVTSGGIGKLRQEIDDTVTKPIEKLKTGINETTLGASGGFMGFAGWGVLGSLIFGWHYNDVQNDARTVLSQAVDTLHQWDP